jgi:hypothetical protein
VTCSTSARAATFPFVPALTKCGDSFAVDIFVRRSSRFDTFRIELLQELEGPRYRFLSAESGGPAAVRSSMRWSLLCAS